VSDLRSLPVDRPFTVEHFAEAIGCSSETVKDWIDIYALRGVKKCGSRVFIVDPMAFYASMPDFETGAPAPVRTRTKKPKPEKTPGAKRGKR
jgi:hypothetical protein